LEFLEKKKERKVKKKKEKNLTIGKRHNIRTAEVKHGYCYILIKRETCREKKEEKRKSSSSYWMD
jgi:hypothetical protein